MFPAETLQSSPPEINPNIFASKNENEIGSYISFSHSISLFTQLDRILSIGNQIFTDISESFDKLNSRVQNLKSHLQDFQSKASQIISTTENLDPNSFLTQGYETKSLNENMTSNLQNPISSDLNDDTNFCQNFLSNLATDQIYPSNDTQLDFHQLEQNSSDLSLLESQLTKEFKQENQAEKQIEEKHETDNSQSSIQFSHTHNSIRYPFLLHPPPRGETQNWKHQAILSNKFNKKIND